MATKKRKKPKPRAFDPLAMPQTRWGTKAQGKQNERERGYKNRIHELEQQLIELRKMHDDQAIRMAKYLERHRPPSEHHMESLKAVCALPMSTAIRLGVDGHVKSLCGWLDSLQRGWPAEGMKS